MRETDPTRPAPEPALEPDALAEPATPVVPGIPDDDDDILADTFVEGELPQLPVEALQLPDEFDDMNLDGDEPAPRPVTGADSIELEVDVDVDESESARLLALANSESS